MKEKIFYLKTGLILVQALCILSIINIIVKMDFYGILFIFVTFAYYGKLLTEILLKIDLHKYDIAYNIMQIGYTIYLIILTYRIQVNKILPFNAFTYLKHNLLILCVLLMFIFVYSLLIKKDLKDEE